MHIQEIIDFLTCWQVMCLLPVVLVFVCGSTLAFVWVFFFRPGDATGDKGPLNARLLSLVTIPVDASGTLSPSVHDLLGHFWDEVEEVSELGRGQHSSGGTWSWGFSSSGCGNIRGELLGGGDDRVWWLGSNERLSWGGDVDAAWGVMQQGCGLGFIGSSGNAGVAGCGIGWGSGLASSSSRGSSGVCWESQGSIGIPLSFPFHITFSLNRSLCSSWNSSNAMLVVLFRWRAGVFLGQVSICICWGFTLTPSTRVEY